MAVIVGSARIDENGKARGGKAGDQTGRELSTQAWYDRWTNPWVLLRPKLAAHAEKIAVCMERACANQRIGYDQGGRDTLYNAARLVGFDVSKVTSAVETDCSALVRVCCAYAGITVRNFRTTDEATVLVATGHFEKLTAVKYIHSSTYLRRGDILVTKRQGHTVVVLSDGPKAGKVYAYGARILSKGTDGPDVIAMQKYLLALEYSLGKWGADGDFGSTTLAAVKKFQTDAKLVVDGSMDAADLAKLKEIAENGWPMVQPPAPPPPVIPGETVYPVRGIRPDISDNQGQLDLAKLAAGNDFAIFRVVRGNDLNDSQAVRNMSGCQARGFPFGVYHFFKPYSAADAKALARKMYDACAKYKPETWWLDVETLYPGRTHADMREYITAYVAEMRALGVKKLGLYMGEYRFNAWYYPIAHLFDALWIAHYGLNTGYLSNIPVLVKGWNVALHQYTSMAGQKGVPGAPGVKVRVDLNRLTGVLPLSWFTGRKHSGVEAPGLVQATKDIPVLQGPGAAYKAIGKIPKDRYAIKRDGSVTGWQAVTFEGKPGFVAANYVRAVSEQ
ncbi:MAG TPA: GH25 family lysozyme [Candidatus Limiplasma sp.]|nr:GH25 family lysozyme [Candidatus Limiplasma sp.]